MISRSPYRPLEKTLGYRFRDRSLLEAALTHPSWRHEKGEAARTEADNQRLEFLGDAALGLVAAHSLFTSYPDAPEGDLTRLRAQLVSTKNLAKVARRLKLGPWLRLGNGEENNGGRNRASNLADAVEALLGAAFLDGGLKAASPLFAQWFLADETPRLGEGSAHENAKGALQEQLQQSGLGVPHYEIVETAGPDHARIFQAEVSLEGEVIGTGEGSSKRAAEMAAARNALRRQDESPPDPTPETPS